MGGKHWDLGHDMAGEEEWAGAGQGCSSGAGGVKDYVAASEGRQGAGNSGGSEGRGSQPAYPGQQRGKGWCRKVEQVRHWAAGLKWGRVRALRGAGVALQWLHCPTVTAHRVGRTPCVMSSYTAPLCTSTAPLFPPGYISRLPPPVDAADVEPVLRALQSAQRPVIYYGGGCLDARDELREFAERTGIPLASTFMGLGVVPADHPNVSVFLSHA